MDATCSEGAWALGLPCTRCRKLTPIFIDAPAPVIGRFAFECALCGAAQEGETNNLKRFAIADAGARKQAAA